jgi:hypothetical protein
MRSALSLRFLVIGNPENRRIGFFQAALQRLGMTPARVVSYLDLLAGRTDLLTEIGAFSVVRIESPGEDFEVEKALLLLGQEAAAAEGSPFLEANEIRRLGFDRGIILYPRQWYLGFRRLLEQLEVTFAAASRVLLLNPPNDIAVMFDKEVCHARLMQAGIPVPLGLGRVRCYEELMARMRQAGIRRAFVKLSNGSSASGVVAFSIVGGKPLAITSAEMVQSGGQTRLYNSLRLRSYRDPATIGQLIDSLCRQRVHVEEWLPKASLGQGESDLRAVTIGGEPRHAVLRVGRGPITNLHLGNRRGEITVFRERLGPAHWCEVEGSCRRVAALFPHALHTALDICVTPDWRRHAVLEVNAFGDLLPGVFWQGSDTYTTEVTTVLKRYGCC